LVAAEFSTSPSSFSTLFIPKITKEFLYIFSSQNLAIAKICDEFSADEQEVNRKEMKS
jgi:hypothetical protein